MNYEDVEILMFKKSSGGLAMNYVNPENKNCSISDDQNPHADLIKTLDNLGPTLAKQFWIDDVNKEHFFCTGFTIGSKGDSKFVILSGKVETGNGHIVGLSSGQMVLEENSKDPLGKMIEKVQKEAYAYFFEDKTAQGKLDFKEKKEDE
jgi:hypothetical protein